jgi:putative phage-type endonuclease
MGLTAVQLAQRQLGIGSSEIPVVAGVSPHGNKFDLWAEKCGLKPANDAGVEALVGQFFEDGAAQLYSHLTGKRLRNPRRTYQHRDRSWMVATPDRFELAASVREPDGSKSGGALAVGEDESILEIKVPGRWAQGWDFNADAGLPHHVECQVQWQMAVTGLHAANVFAVAGTEPHIFEVAYDPETVAYLIALGEEFWAHVESRTPPEPDGSEACDRALRLKWAKDRGVMLPATPYARGLVEDLRVQRKKAEEAQKAADIIEQHLKLHIAEAAGIEGLCSWTANAAGAVLWKNVAMAGNPPPELIAAHRGPQARVFRLKGAK